MNRDEYLEALFNALTVGEVDALVVKAGMTGETSTEDFQEIVNAGETRKLAIEKRAPVSRLDTAAGSLDETIDAKGAEVAEELRQESAEKKTLVEQAAASLTTIPQGMELTEEQVDATVRHFRLFERVKKEVLDPRVDILYIGSDGKPMTYANRKQANSVYIRKSGWRKLGMVFGINLKVVSMDREDHEDENGTYYLWNARVLAEHPTSMKYAEGIGVASSRDQFFTRAGKRLADEKDIKLKAQTVGENRAISNLIGGGQMTAEEV